MVVWRRRLSLPTRAATLAAASLVAAPLSLLYDLMLGAIAAAWLVRDREAPAAALWEKWALAALYLLLLDGRGLAEDWHVPAYPLAAIALFAIAAARAWREMAGQDLPLGVTSSPGLTRGSRAASQRWPGQARP